MPYIWPWPKGTPISQEYGTNPSNGINPAGGHTGKDGVLDIGTPLRAPGDGVIVYEGFPGANYLSSPWWLTDGAGLVVVLDCGDSEPTFILGHCNETFVNVGQRVKKGDIIAASGNTGRWTTGPHCHFEMLLPGYIISGPTYGRSRPDDVCTGYWEDSINPHSGGGAGTRIVTVEGANVRLAPFSDADRAIGYEDGLALGAEITVVGYVKGEDVTGNGDNAWYKTRSGFFVWANGAGNDLGGLAYLGEVSRPAPAPAPVPTPVPAPAPAPIPAPAPEPVGPRLHGVDVSNHQTGLDLLNLPGDFAIMKASEGVGYTDPALSVFALSMATSGRLRGFYHFARPNAQAGNTAAAEAAHFLSVVKPLLRAGDLLVLDWESDDIRDVAWALEWLRIVQRETGCTPLIYMNTATVNGADWSQVEQEFPLWLASYPTTEPVHGFTVPAKVVPAGWAKGYVMWQYSSAGQLDGWTGSLDLNVWFGTREEWLALGAPEPATPTPDPDPVIVIEPAPAVDEAEVLRKFIDWLITQYLNSKE